MPGARKPAVLAKPEGAEQYEEPGPDVKPAPKSVVQFLQARAGEVTVLPGEYVLAGHEVQLLEPDAPATVPGGQRTHAVAPAEA